MDEELTRLRDENARLWRLVETLEAALRRELVEAQPRPAEAEEPLHHAEEPRRLPAMRERHRPRPEGCRVVGCANPHRAQGLCARHYQKMKRGTLEEADRPKRP